MLSATYAHERGIQRANAFADDPENRLLWRANRRRLDAEAVRDALLAVTRARSTKTAAGRPRRLPDDNNRRTVYGFVSRRRLDATLALFDFPNPNSTSEQRMDTNVPLQRLFFLNSAFVLQQAKALAEQAAAAERRSAKHRAGVPAAVRTAADAGRAEARARVSEARRTPGRSTRRCC